MKRMLIWSIAGLALGAVIVVAGADGPKWSGWHGHRWDHFGPAGYLAHELNLSDAQMEQIRTIWLAEKPTVAHLLREVVAEGEEMDAATAQGSRDNPKVEEIAARQGASIAQLLLEKEGLESKIYTSVLNTEQRTKADEIQRRWHARLGQIADR